MSYRTVRAHLGKTEDSPFLEFRIPSDLPGRAASLFDAYFKAASLAARLIDDEGASDDERIAAADKAYAICGYILGQTYAGDLDAMRRWRLPDGKDADGKPIAADGQFVGVDRREQFGLAAIVELAGHGIATAAGVRETAARVAKVCGDVAGYTRDGDGRSVHFF